MKLSINFSRCWKHKPLLLWDTGSSTRVWQLAQKEGPGRTNPELNATGWVKSHPEWWSEREWPLWGQLIELFGGIRRCSFVQGGTSWTGFWGFKSPFYQPLLGRGSIVELALVMGDVCMSQPQGHKCGRTDSTTCLPWGDAPMPPCLAARCHASHHDHQVMGLLSGTVSP